MQMNIDPYSMSRHAMLNRAIEEFITIRPIAVRKTVYTRRWAGEAASRHWVEVRMVLTVTRQDSGVFIGVQATWWALPYRRFMRVVPLFCCTRVFTVSPCRLLMPGGSLKVIHSQHRVSSRHYASLISHRLGCSVIVSPARSLLIYSYLSAQQSWQDRCTTSNRLVHLSV